MTLTAPNLAPGLNKLEKFRQKSYRDGYLETRIRSAVARQIKALRNKFGMTQAQFGELIGKKQPVVCRLEDGDYSGTTISSLLDVATASGVALVVQFVSYPEFLRRTADLSDKALQPETIVESLERRTIEDSAAYAGAWHRSTKSPQADEHPTLSLLTSQGNPHLEMLGTNGLRSSQLPVANLSGLLH